MKNRILALVLALALLLTSAAFAEAPAQHFTPGTYTAEAEGIRSTVKVEVTFSETEITDIQIVEHGETRFVADPALEKIPQAILASQSVAVDTVSSVTFTSRAVINAVTKACEQAGGDMALLREKKQTVAEDETVEADVVVVGMGLAGVTACISALDAGAKVVAVEKMGAAGGSSKYSGGFITAFGTSFQKELGYEQTPDQFVQSYFAQQDASVKEEEIDRDAVRAMIERSASDVEFLISHEIGINPKPTNFVPDGVGYWHFPDTRTGPFDGEAAGADHIVHGLNWLEKNENFSIYYNTPAVEILTEDGAAAGVVCQRKDGSRLTVKAKGVVLATGGWAANPDMMARFCPDFPLEWTVPYTTANIGNTGDGITMAEALGAAVYENGWWMDLANGVDFGGYQTYFPNTLNGMIDRALYLVVNGKGERCTNTNSLYGPRSINYAKAMKETGKIFAIFTPEGFANGIEFIEANNRVDNVNIFKADTLEALAEATGMDAETFTAQVERYNGFCAAGKDEDWGQSTLIPVGEGPYYAVLIKTITMGTLGGLRTNEDSQVLSTAGEPIPGLFAAGELINGKYFNQAYVSGCAQLLCTDSGIIAGANAAK